MEQVVEKLKRTRSRSNSESRIKTPPPGPSHEGLNSNREELIDLNSPGDKEVAQALEPAERSRYKAGLDNMDLKSNLLQMLNTQSKEDLNNALDNIVMCLKDLQLQSIYNVRTPMGIRFHFRFTPADQILSNSIVRDLRQNVIKLQFNGKNNVMEFLEEYDEILQGYNGKLTDSQAALVMREIIVGTAKETIRNITLNLSNLANRLLLTYSQAKTSLECMRHALSFPIKGDFLIRVPKLLNWVKLAVSSLETELERSEGFNQIGCDLLLGYLPDHLQERFLNGIGAKGFSRISPYDIVDNIVLLNQLPNVEIHLRSKALPKQINEITNNSEENEMSEDEEIKDEKNNRQMKENSQNNSAKNKEKFCKTCSKKGHESSYCFKNRRCTTCGRMGHTSSKCYSKNCLLCGGITHQSIGCPIYNGAANPPVELPCRQCFQLYGSKMYHTESACIHNTRNEN